MYLHFFFMTNCLFSYIKRKNVYFLSGCCFAVLELLGVGFSVCYCQFLFCQLPCSKDQFHRLCAPFYRSEYQKYLKLKKKKVVLFQQGKVCLCVLLFMLLYISISFTHLCVYFYIYMYVFIHILK